MARWIEGALLAGALLVSAGCDGDDPLDPEAWPVFEIEQAGERFNVAVANAGVAAELDALLESGAAAGALNGVLVAGDGGFNAPYSWHLDPETVEVVDFAMELCDGKPSFVEEHLDYFLGTVERYCPWGAKVVGRSD